MNKPKPEEVMKALECCKGGGNACLDCIYFYRAVDTSCAPFLIKDALALIRELIEENERLKAQRYMAYPDGRIEMIPMVEGKYDDHKGG